MRTSRFFLLFAAVAAFVLGTLFKLRVFPFLKASTIESGGKQMPTAEFASFGALLFYGFGALCLIGAIIWMFRRKKP